MHWSKETDAGTTPLAASQMLFQGHQAVSSILSSTPRSNPGSTWRRTLCLFGLLQSGTHPVYSCLSWPWPFEKYWSDTLKIVPRLGFVWCFLMTQWGGGTWGRTPQRWGGSAVHQVRRAPGSVCSITGNTVARSSPHPSGEETISTWWEEMYQRVHGKLPPEHYSRRCCICC